jgi:hypothetical protein
VSELLFFFFGFTFRLSFFFLCFAALRQWKHL